MTMVLARVPYEFRPVPYSPDGNCKIVETWVAFVV